jgi:hypothetical protein
MQSLELRPACDGVAGIIVGAMTIDQVRIEIGTRRVVVEATFIANYSEIREGQEQGLYVEEKLVLTRFADAKSREPEAARTIGCPNCGAALEKPVGDKCKYCGVAASSDIYDWKVESWTLVNSESIGPTLTGSADERGNYDPTIVAPDAKEKWAKLCADDPTMTWDRFVNRVETIFHAFQDGWSNQALERVRPYLSDSLFEIQQYWVSAYKAQGLRNVTAAARVVTMQIAKVSRDQYFEAITIRLFASSLDYTVRGDITVAGSRTKPREYTEYWTLIRTRKDSHPTPKDSGCPNCGAPLDKINMAGDCESCGVKITRGQFDWVLSRIEQDEVYAG